MEDSTRLDATTSLTEEGERRLPVYFLLDTSEGMPAASVEAMCRGLEQFKSEIQSDTFALEKTWVGIITFGGKAEFVTNGLIPISEFAVLQLTAGGENVLGQALQVLAQSLDRDISPPTKGGSKGDWLARVFILLASEPTDDWKAPRERILQREKAKICSALTVGCGPHLNQQSLRDIAIGRTYLTDTDDSSFKALFEWTSTLVLQEESSNGAQEEGRAQIAARPAMIDLGCLSPGSNPRAKIMIEGGPARATTDNQRIALEPSEIGEEPTEIEITITDGSDGELIWETLHIRGDNGELEIPVICMWDEALSRSFRQSTRRSPRRRAAEPADPEEFTAAPEESTAEDMDDTEIPHSVPPTDPLAANTGKRTYIAPSCPRCRRNLHYDSDNRTWLACGKCRGPRRLISPIEGVATETMTGIQKDGKKIMRDLWEVLIGKQDWNLK